MIEFLAAFSGGAFGAMVGVAAIGWLIVLGMRREARREEQRRIDLDKARHPSAYTSADFEQMRNDIARHRELRLRRLPHIPN